MAEQPIIAAGLDAGSRSTRLVICALKKNRIRFLGHASVESQGWVKARIADQKAVADSIGAALREAEAAAGVSVGAVTAGIGGPDVRGGNTRGAVELGYLREVVQRDVNRALDHASRVQWQNDRMLLQLFPQDFVVDGHAGYRDPRGMMAATLEANAHLITASEREHDLLVGAVNQAHLVVEETVFEAVAACYAAVKPDERRQGIALVDIGAHSTGIAAFDGDALRLASTAPICGDHFTADLAKPLRLSFDEAEVVKMEFGGALASACPPNVRVELPTEENRERRDTTRTLINQVLEARGEDLFAYVRSELARVGMDRALLGGVFLTGGGAKLPDLCDVADRVLQCQVRYGLAVGIQDWPEELNDQAWCVAAGLAMYSARLKAHAEQEREAGGWLSRILK